VNSFFAIALALAVGILSACGSQRSLSQPSNTSSGGTGISNLRSEISDTEKHGLANSETININTASSEELQRIPHIGPSLARKVIEHREEHGPFKRPEELMQVQGISDVRFRRIRHLIRVE